MGTAKGKTITLKAQRQSTYWWIYWIN